MLLNAYEDATDTGTLEKLRMQDWVSVIKWKKIIFKNIL